MLCYTIQKLIKNEIKNRSTHSLVVEYNEKLMSYSDNGINPRDWSIDITK